MVAELQYQELSELAHFERAAALRNQYVWMAPVTGEQLQDYAARFPEGVDKRAGLFADTADRGYVRVVQAFWTHDEGLYTNSISYDEASYSDALGDFLIKKSEEFAREFGATTMTAWLHSDRPELIQAYMRAGYEPGQINPMSALKLSDFDPTPYLENIEEVKANGYELTTVAVLKDREPERWEHMYWRHDMDIMADVPLPEPFVDIPFETFKQDLAAKDTDLSLLFIAMKDGEIAGGSGLMQNLVDRTIGNTGLTGTHRAHRRQKLATAMKVTALMEAKSRGMEMIFTDNEEKNPMLRLNEALGFKPVLYMQEYRRQLT
ncbi:MAG: GNAT family N-acetyltransferase [Chthonomonas sp.]|nr:GNAT family N-acetyltransferase [Chthonomonas sp.]